MLRQDMRPLRRTALVIALSLFAAGCGQGSSDPPGIDADASCANIVFYQGHEYGGRTAVVYPAPGTALGKARLPGCNDTGDTSPPPDELIDVARLPGVDPNVAFLDAGSPQVIYIRSNVEVLPPEIARFFEAPTCSKGDAPIQMGGTWLGILGADGDTELDLEPPYDVTMLVARSSSPRYLDAELTVRVPASLGAPLTHEDVKSSLWEAGSIEITATCDGEGFVAESVQAFEP